MYHEDNIFLKQINNLDEKRMHIQALLIARSLKCVLKKLRGKSVIVVLADKSNSFKVVHTAQYIKCIDIQLNKAAISSNKRSLS